ncbi:hypothetical protein [Streptomyces xanthophaeus]|uniref:hypothetical protein n=1 Tax=Streptomyces xanthophaeus TaxID=67385 RepID=UPI00264942CD|nr:hypothetical protein [Streptomyces xanthophaeus]WKD36485.1 hypothetical protein KO717_34175 [Streptomyces xanthophaeus]
MHDLPDPPQERPTLTAPQAYQVRRATRVLAAARIADLAQLTLDPAESIIMIEGLRGALDDTLRLIEERYD